MKRKDIIAILRKAGFTFSEGGEHTKAYDANGAYRTTIGRHTEIALAVGELASHTDSDSG